MSRQTGLLARRAAAAFAAVVSFTPAFALAADAPATLLKISSQPGVQTAVAGWYGDSFDGLRTTSGERFDMYRLTAASATLPLGSYVAVSNPATGERVVVRINDRQSAGEAITLSYAAANRIGLAARKASTVRVEYLGESPDLSVASVVVASR